MNHLCFSAKLKKWGRRLKLKCFTHNQNFYIDNSDSMDFEDMWNEFHNVSLKLRRNGVLNDNFYTEIKDLFLRYSCDQHYDNLNNFKYFLMQSRKNIASCKYPDILFKEIKLRFELAKETFKECPIMDDNEFQMEWNEVIFLYNDVLAEVADHMQEEKFSSLFNQPTKTKPNKDESNLNDDLLQEEQASPEAKKRRNELLFENFFDKVIDHITLDIKDPETIKVLLNSVNIWLKSITEMGLNNDSTQQFIAKKIIQKFNEETLQQFKGCLKLSQQISVFDFLEYKMENPQNDPRINPEAIYLQTNEISTLNLKNKEHTEIKQASILDENFVQMKDQRDNADTASDANEMINSFHNATLNKSKSSTEQELYEKRQSDEILDSHIRSLRDGIILESWCYGENIILNLQTPGLSEAQIREFYKTTNAPTSFKAFVTPLLQKTLTFLEKLIVFPEEKQGNTNSPLDK